MLTPHNRVLALQGRLGLSDKQLAHYLGVPLATAYKWTKGERAPPAVAHRLMDVLALIEMTAPEIHASLIGEGK